MKKQIQLIGIGAFLCLGLSNQAQAYERVFYEDCENTNFDEHFLENHFGSNYATTWNDIKRNTEQSTIAHNGNYSILHNPFGGANPHTRVGLGNIKYGNLSNFNLSSVHSRYWYFRWYQRWQSGSTYNGANKNIYINLQSAGDFWTALEKHPSADGKTIWSYAVKSHKTREFVVSPKYITVSADFDDDIWHKMEYYIDVGTTGGNNGEIKIWIDDTEVHNKTDITFNPTIHSNPIEHIAIPANASAESGSQNVYVDDISFYTLDNSTDIPPESGSSDTTTLTQITPIQNPTNDNTPDYTFSSNKAGTIAYGGDCSSSTTSAISGNNTITLNSLTDGTYSNCTITVTDTAGHTSNSLSIHTFTINSSPTSSTKADVDLSGSIDIIDALLTFRNSLGLAMSGTTWKESATGDSNCDGISNSVDVRLILRDSLDLNMNGTGWCVTSD